jgi:hypothetical protein
MSLSSEPTASAQGSIPPARPAGTWLLPIAVAWSLVVALGGGLACGLCIDRYGELGALSLAACGAFAGYISRKITRGPSKTAGLCQAIAACLAFVDAYTWWIHWRIVQGEASWWTALGLWPVFVREYELPALIGALFAGYGAWCAYGYATSPGPPPNRPASPTAPSP